MNSMMSPGEDSIAAGDSYLVKDRRILLGVGLLLTPRKSVLNIR
ncbi:MAG: hypothetical protein ACP5IA_03335 [Sediminispirochaetaceae bacterium]